MVSARERAIYRRFGLTDGKTPILSTLLLGNVGF